MGFRYLVLRCAAATVFVFLLISATNSLAQVCSPSGADRTVTICGPLDKSVVSSPVQVSAAANDSNPVTSIQIYVDGLPVYTKLNTNSIDVPLNLPTGTHRITVQAKDSYGVFKSTVYATVTGCAPSTTDRTVTICSPASGASVTSPVQIKATATDSNYVQVMQIYLDYQKVFEVTGTKSLDTTLDLAPGSHRLVVQAKDALGYYKSVTNFTVTSQSAPPEATAVTTWRNDLSRTGQNLTETVLKPSNVTPTTFGKKFSYSVDGYVFAQPLVVPGVMIGGAAQNVVYVATAHDSVYAFDADGNSSTPYWTRSFIDPANGITTVPGEDVGVTNEWGITATPVIDRASNTLYVLERTKDTVTNTYAQHLHALDLSTGEEKFGGPVLIQACVAGAGDGSQNGQVCFDPLRENSRAALTLSNGVVYLAWASLADIPPYHGWVIGYDAATLQNVSVFNTSPEGQAAGIWQGGAGLSADSNGNLFGITGEGSFDPSSGNYGDTFTKLSTIGGGLTVSDYFTPFDQAYLDANNLDLGSTGPVLLPPNNSDHPNELIGAGKNGHVYLVDRDNMGKFESGINNVVQELTGFPAGIFTTPAYWNGNVYFIANGDTVKQYGWSGGMLSVSPVKQGDHIFPYPGASPAVSANGDSNGIVWAIEKNSVGMAVLHAYDATDVSKELYNSSMNPSRDAADSAVKFTVPTIANGKVYVGTASSLVVYGLL